MNMKVQKIFSHMSSSLTYLLHENPAEACVFGAVFCMEQWYFQIVVDCKNYHPSKGGKQALNHGLNFFSNLKFCMAEKKG